MKFIKYSSLENHYRTKFMEIVQMQPCVKDEWVATEKLHGANFSLWYDNGEVKAAKRSGFIKEGESFYGCVPVVEKYSELLPVLANSLNIDRFVLFGELVGEGVQKGVNYCEGKDFVVFDAAIITEDSISFLDYTVELVSLLESAGFSTATILKRGTFEEVMSVDNTFNSTYNSQDFVAEGYVAKPITTAFLPNGSRVAIKSKTDKFSEKKQVDKPKPQLPDHIVELVPLVEDYITENRFNNVLSKEGEFDVKMFGKYIGLLTHDALEDYCKDNEVELESSDVKTMKKQLASKARQIIQMQM